MSNNSSFTAVLCYLTSAYTPKTPLVSFLPLLKTAAKHCDWKTISFICTISRKRSTNISDKMPDSELQKGLLNVNQVYTLSNRVQLKKRSARETSKVMSAPNTEVPWDRQKIIGVTVTFVLCLFCLLDCLLTRRTIPKSALSCCTSPVV